MHSESELLNVEYNVFQLMNHHISDNPRTEVDHEAVEKSAKELKAAAMLSTTLNKQVAMLREKISGEAGAEANGLDSQIKDALLRI